MSHPLSSFLRLSTLAYTALGYLALGLHHLLYVPGLAEDPSWSRGAVVLLNLAAGAVCFVCALRKGWTPREITSR